MLPDVAEQWIRRHVRPAGPVEVAHQRPWSTVARVPVAGGAVWFKACSEVHAFEPRLTAELSSRWPDLVPEVLAYDEVRAWLLLADAGSRIGDLGNDPRYWLSVLPRYAELQRGEVPYSPAHLAAGVPDLRVASLPARYDDLLHCELPLCSDERRTLEGFAPRFEELCDQMAEQAVPDSVQHDDLHMNNVFARDGRLRVLDWGDSCISHPFVSLVATFRFLEERNGLEPGDPWFARLRDSYLEAWGPGLGPLFALAMSVGGFAHAVAALRQRAALARPERDRFDGDLAVRLRRALAGTAR